MPRHYLGQPPSTPGLTAPAPARSGRRLAAAVLPVAGTGLLGGPPAPAAPPAAPPADPERGGAGSVAVDPTGRRVRIRWRTGRPGAVLLCLLATAFLAWFWWQAANATAQVSPLSAVNPAEAGGPVEAGGQAEEGVPEAVRADTGPQTVPEALPRDAPGEGGGSIGGGGKGGERIVIHVAGAVLRAGIVELPRGSRLHEAITAAGGSTPDSDPGQLNLASVLEDGQKVVVPRQGEAVPAAPAPADAPGVRGSPGSAQGGPPAAGKTNLNTAGVEELATLPRVGPVLAQRIVDWRTQHGRFQRVEELDAVDGFGPKLLESLLALVRV